MIDDIIIGHETLEGLIEHMVWVLGRLLAVSLVSNLAQGIFFAPPIKYLGYILGDGKISSDPAKAEEFLLTPPPTNKTAVCRFLGMCVLHRRMISSYVELVNPISHWVDQG